MDLLATSLQIGFIYAIGVLGLMVAFRIVGFPDLTMEGSFTAGASLSAILIAAGVNPLLALLISPIVGVLAGICTALLHVKANVSKLLAGIIMVTVLYTINLRIMGRSNISLLHYRSIFDLMPGDWSRVTVIVIAAGIIAGLLLIFLRTEFGLCLRAVGENPRVVTASGFPVSFFTVIGLALANGLIALSGAMMSQLQGYSDIGMGAGLIVVAFASLLIGETVLPPRTVPKLIAAAVVGAWIYQLINAFALRFGIAPSDFKLATGVLLAVAVVLKNVLGRGRIQENVGCTTL